MKKLLQIFKDDELDFKTAICILILVMVFSAIIGFIYEEVFYLIDLGYFVKRGSTFGPWIPIYAWGSLLIVYFTYSLRKKPILVFLLNCFITGFLEYGTGYVLDHFFHKKLWDYNVEILNFGNINGYICFRSILLFGLASLFLIYNLIPRLIKLSKKISLKKLSFLAYILGLLFVLDMIIYIVIE